MTTIGRVWSKAARRIAARRGPFEDHEEGRFRWVREHAPGKSFADIGGMFRYVGEISFLAEACGATTVTMFDVGDPDLICEGHEDWGWFDDKHRKLKSKVVYVQGDLEEPETPGRVGIHDVVFYSGVLYHTPNPLLQLMQLRKMTGELLFLSTLTIPEIPGFPNACVFYPYLSGEDRRPYAAGYHWSSELIGIGSPIDERPMFGYGNCWWGISRSALYSMLRTARFEVVHERKLAYSPFLTELECRPLPLDPLLPPVNYFRARSEARERGEERFSFAEWYDEQRE